MAKNATLQVQVDKSQPIRVNSPNIILVIRNNSSDIYSNVNIELEHRHDIQLYPLKIHLDQLAPGYPGIKKIRSFRAHAAGSYIIRGRANYFVESRDRRAEAMEVELHIRVAPAITPEQKRTETGLPSLVRVPDLEGQTNEVTLPGEASVPNSIAQELRQQLKRGDLILFLGAGLSIGAGLPGWGRLIRPLARAVGYRLPTEDELVTADHLLIAAQHYENQRSRYALITYLQEKLDTTGVQPTTNHHLLAKLPVKVIFTTNYDDLIERTLQAGGKRHNVIVEETEIPFWREDRVQLVKLNGDLKRPDTIVITKSDYNTYFAAHPRLAERLRGVLETKTALFLGYSLNDPFFNQIWDNIGLDFGRHRRLAYAVLFDVPGLEADDLEKRGIKVVNLQSKRRNKSALLEGWLRGIA